MLSDLEKINREEKMCTMTSAGGQSYIVYARIHVHKVISDFTPSVAFLCGSNHELQVWSESEDVVLAPELKCS